jgi:uncharacterized protein (DUF58 family)
MLRPAKVHAGFIVLALLAGAFFGISRTSGAGWATVLVAGVIGTCVAAFILPALVLTRPRLTIETPDEGTVGIPLNAIVSGREGIVANIAELGTGPFALGSGTLTACPQRRGVVTGVTASLHSGAPLGLVTWKRTIAVTLREKCEVGPQPMPAGIPDPQQRFENGDEYLRGVRPYVPGDSIKKVHWPATARTGALAVRQYDAPAQPEIVIVVDLTGPDAEAIASRAAGLAGDILSGGVTVSLATCEPSGPRTEQVATRSDVNRRLARAVSGPLNVPSDCVAVSP